ncbi:hypothetical protein SUGI_0306650 [Cryptomeria japonica]|uniref:uncharacterized protein LOC131063313 n=1 Tax=Cryptomeria japonica TaxID=3369 RepID=UPI002408D25E|nr:uncharacterized protein LOC131063313 [Cryptomeria japonica]GLJ17611.1 hypothetical protein SUGI_0306650 [Cryptomeria japonica]
MAMVIQLVAAAATAAAAILAYRKLTCDRVLEEQYRLLIDTAAKLSVTSKHPATILILGFENHGRSSFINTVIRVLCKENGPLVMRAETGPSKKTTTTTRVFAVKNKLLMYPKYLANLIDTPTFSASDVLDEQKVRTILRGENAVISNQKDFPPPECAVIVIRADAAGAGAPASENLPDLARIIREEGLQFVVVLTHRKQAQKAMDLKELTRQVAQMMGTDYVQCVDNYVAENFSGANVKNNLNTDIQTLSIMRQCFEYVKQRRHLNKSSKLSDKTQPAQLSSDSE